MFARVLVANRGEIAVRVIRALHELGHRGGRGLLDRRRGRAARPARRPCGLHRAAARGRELPQHSVGGRRGEDDRLRRRPSRVRASSPRTPPSSEACEENDLVFIGPGADVMERMGDKVRAKAEMAAAGVPLVPGTEGAATLGRGARAARRARLPGAAQGDRGRRRQGDAARRRRRTSSRALTRPRRPRREAAFGDGALYVEKAVAPARHVEIQVLCDAQRRRADARRARVLDPAAPPEADRGVALAGARRRRRARQMEAAAERACRAIGYRNAGTFEFLLGPDGAFYFIELNARLQVEHPVTELVTGIDIVREQVRDRRRRAALADRARAAARPRDRDPDQRRGPGARLPARARDVDALPRRRSARACGSTRASSEGDAIPPFYDSLIAKLVVWDEDRPPRSRAAMRALAELEIEGVPTTQRAAARHPRERALPSGDYSTGFLAEVGELPACDGVSRRPARGAPDGALPPLPVGRDRPAARRSCTRARSTRSRCELAEAVVGARRGAGRADRRGVRGLDRPTGSARSSATCCGSAISSSNRTRAAEVAIAEAVDAGEALRVGRGGAARQRHPRADREGGGMSVGSTELTDERRRRPATGAERA